MQDTILKITEKKIYTLHPRKNMTIKIYRLIFNIYLPDLEKFNFYTYFPLKVEVDKNNNRTILLLLSNVLPREVLELSYIYYTNLNSSRGLVMLSTLNINELTCDEDVRQVVEILKKCDSSITALEEVRKIRSVIYFSSSTYEDFELLDIFIRSVRGIVHIYVEFPDPIPSVELVSILDWSTDLSIKTLCFIVSKIYDYFLPIITL